VELLDLVFPKKCVGCGKVGGYVCRDCEVGMWEEEQICPVCTRASRYGLRHRYCRESGSIEGLICFWAYEGIAQKLIKQAKYRFYYDYLGELLAGIGTRPELEYFYSFLKEGPLVVPVPLWPKREKERGFNQAEVIAKMVGKQWGLNTGNLLVRVKDTGHQTGRSRRERLEAVKDAFKLKIDGLLAKTILLVDDVWTTGATMRECTRVLKRAGVGRVWGLVLAR
jgi:competence protein ComFC